MKTLTATVVTVTMAMTAGQTMAAAAAPAATAAAAAPAPVAATVTHGPPITGLCVLSATGVQGLSLYGKAIDAQLTVISKQINDELVDQKNKLTQEVVALEKNKATVTELVYQQTQLTLQDKYNTFTNLTNQRQQEMDATEQGQNQVFSTELQKIAVKVYQDQKCSILLDRDASIMIASPAMDVTEQVIKAMDQDKTTVAPFAKVSIPASPTPTGVTTR